MTHQHINLAARLRHLATTLDNQTGRTTRTQRTAETILHTAITLWHDGDTAATRAHQWAARGYPNGNTGPTGKGTHGDSTPTAAGLAGDEGDIDPPGPETRYHRRLTQLRRWLEADSVDLGELLAKITDTPGTGRTTTITECAEPHCHDPAPKPRRGRCEPCARWRQRWLEQHPASTWIDVPPVPPTVIEERRIRRRRVTPTEPA